MNLSEFSKLALKARGHIIRFMPEWDYDLGGACGVASYHLMRLANKVKVYPDFVAGTFSMDGESQGHCWIEYQNHIVDLTATQFSIDYDAIHIVPTNDMHYLFDFKTNITLNAYNNALKSWASYPFELRFLSK